MQSRYSLAIKTVAVSIAAAAIFSCASQTQKADYFMRQNPRQESLQHSPLRSLEKSKTYVVLIDAYDDIKQLSKAAGFSGRFGHIIAIADNQAFDCSPPKCAELTIPGLELKYTGHAYNIREVDFNGDTKKAIAWFRTHMQDRPYNLYYRNCADVPVGMYEASGATIRLIKPLPVKSTYEANARLRNFMQTHNMPLPEREFVFLPDQFENIGQLVGTGTFGR
ncbi:MAG: hypothetical protein V1492_04640 [Candidatus Micrarchaeota archaeon]